LFDALFWSHVAFIILYALQFRDFSMMKAIFVYPPCQHFGHVIVGNVINVAKETDGLS
jgi:hypothetical protein